MVAKYRIPGVRDLLTGGGWFDLSGPVPRLLLRGPDSMRVYELGEDVELRATFPRPSPNWREMNDWLAPDLSFVVFQGETSYTAVDRDGNQMWHQPFGGRYATPWGHVGFAMAGPYRETQTLLRLPSGAVDKTLFVALDTAGNELARSVLPCGGNDRCVELVWGSEGYLTGVHARGGTADGALAKPAEYQASLVCGHVVLGKRVRDKQAAPPAGYASAVRGREAVEWSPSGTGMMTIDGRGRDVRWHRFPSCEVAAELRLSDFPPPGTGDNSVHDHHLWISPYEGGYVDEDTAMVTLHNSYNEARVIMFGEDVWEEHSHWLADPVTGELHGRIAYPMRDVDCVWLLGDGTWVTAEWDTLYRWSARPGLSDPPATMSDT